MAGTRSKLTERGRIVADRIADCYVEVSIGRKYESKDQCRELAPSLGLDLLANGVGRDVYVPDPELVVGDPDCVLKVPTNLLGCTECVRELRYWQDLPGAVRRYLVPVLDYGREFPWLLVPRAERPLTSAETLALWSDMRETGYVFEDANWEHNLGRVDGRPVVLDYGGGYAET